MGTNPFGADATAPKTAVERRLVRAQKKIRILEQLLEDKSRELFGINESLSQSNAYLAEIFRSMAGALFVTDVGGVIRLANGRCGELLGFVEAELIGQPLQVVLPEAATWTTTGDAEMDSRDTAAITKSGVDLPVAVTIGSLPAADDDGGAGRIYIAMDIQERKSAEEQLEKAQRELVEASRVAGMAQVATGVLHNVGNVLNSVNVSAQMAAAAVSSSKAPALARVVSLLKENQSDLGTFLMHDPKGKKVPEFLAALATALDGERAGLSDELGSLCANVEHIREIIVAQQQYARTSEALEVVEIADVFESAIAVNQRDYDAAGIKLVREFRDVPALSADRHRVIQILVNFLTNAHQALIGCESVPKTITVRAVRDNDIVQLDVEDNGPGIAPEHVDRVFSHGFTTKTDGHGFGLHSAANSASEMGGSVGCSSAGLGRGATFSLRLPLRPIGGDHVDE